MKRVASLALAMIMILSLAACGSSTAAATMHLRRTEGTVAVSDGNGKDVPVLDNLGLYSGYGVGTRPASYAWIDLDDVKLAKLDQNSEIAIQKDGRHLEIEVKSGSLYFSVTEPLADDETMNIRASTMLVGIRGTSGWVEYRNGVSRVYILEGKVECSAGDRTVLVNAGEFAELTADGELVVKPFTAEDIPAFVRDEPDAELPDSPDETPAPTETPETSGAPAASDEPETSGAPESTDSPETSDTPIASETPTTSDAPETSDAPTPTATPMPETGNVTWSLNGGTLTISGMGPMEDYKTYYTVPWYEDRDSITKVVIENGVTSIGKNAFCSYRSLTAVTIPNSVTSIGDFAFAECSGLTSVNIPDSVTSIGEHGFSYCFNLTNVSIGSGVTSIGTLAFVGCSSLTSLTIPGSVASIGDDAFIGCSGLTGVTICSGVTSISFNAFRDCGSLTSVTIPASVTSISDGAFLYCSSLTDVYYGGSADQWAQISIDNDYGNNDDLLNATIHYNSTGN